MGLYEKGHPGGPGRPYGSKNRKPLTEFLRTDAPQRVADLIDKEIDRGERWGVAMYMRALPKMRGRPVHLELPPVKTAQDAVDANALVLGAAAEGEITPDEAESLSRTVERSRQAIETAILEKDLRQVERKVAEDEQRQRRLEKEASK